LIKNGKKVTAFGMLPLRRLKMATG
jgi:hypothetical protein